MKRSTLLMLIAGVGFCQQVCFAENIHNLAGIPWHFENRNDSTSSPPCGPWRCVEGEIVHCWWSDATTEWYGITEDNRKVKLQNSFDTKRYRYLGGDKDSCRLGDGKDILRVTRPPGVEKMPISISTVNVLEATGAMVKNRLGEPTSVLVRGKQRVLRYAAPEVVALSRSGKVVWQDDGITTSDKETKTSRKTRIKNVPNYRRKIPWYFEITVDENDKVIGVRDLLIP